jgi:hypothetical protein
MPYNCQEMPYGNNEPALRRITVMGWTAERRLGSPIF